jgi:hypothetical protein
MIYLNNKPCYTPFPMKTTKLTLNMKCLILAFTLISQVGSANPGRDSGGGDIRAIQFKKIGLAIVEYLREGSLPEELKSLDPNRLKKAVGSTTVESTNEVLSLDSQQTSSAVIKDALNSPKKHSILFNREAWDILADGSHRAALVLHEYLGIMKVDDRNYTYSAALYEYGPAKTYFDRLPESQAIEDGLDFDFQIQCTIDYQKAHYVFDPIGSVGSPIVGIMKPGDYFPGYSSTPFIGRKLTQNTNGEWLVIQIFNPNDPNLSMFNPKKKGESGNSIEIALGWTKEPWFDLPERLVFNQKVKLVPNFKLSAELPESQLSLECHRLLTQDFRTEPFFTKESQ